jgi:hypothetical protein
MIEIIESVEQSLKSKNFYSALLVSISLPAICAAIEHGESHNKEYATWFDTNLPNYKGYLTGNDCYALRCALLHEGSDSTSRQRAREVIESYKFIISGNHKLKFTECVFDGKILPNSLVLNVEIFCNDICQAARIWLLESLSKPHLKEKLELSLKIYPAGSAHFNEAVIF